MSRSPLDWTAPAAAAATSGSQGDIGAALADLGDFLGFLPRAGVGTWPSDGKMTATDALRGCWEVAALAQFYRMLAPALKLPQRFDGTGALEQRLQEPDAMPDLVAPLLGLNPRTERVDAVRLWSALEERSESGELVLPFDLGAIGSLEAASASQRAQLLLALAEAVLADRGDDLGALHGAGSCDPSDLRPSLLGQDSESRMYWYLGDYRVYRELLGTGAARAKRDKPPPNATWELVCADSSADWREFIGKLKKRGNEAALRLELLEQVEVIEAREAKREKEKNLEAKREALSQARCCCCGAPLLS